MLIYTLHRRSLIWGLLTSSCVWVTQQQLGCEHMFFFLLVCRDRWAGLREEMVKDPVNRQSLHEVDSALFLVCLESEEPSTREGFSHQMLHGDCPNRYTCTGRSPVHSDHCRLAHWPS